MIRVVAAGRVGGDFTLDPSFLPRVGDTVRFRHTPNNLTLQELKPMRDGRTVAVVIGPTGSFACYPDELRVIQRGD